MVENKDFILKGIVFVIHKFTDLYFLFFIANLINSYLKNKIRKNHYILLKTNIWSKVESSLKL